MVSVTSLKCVQHSTRPKKVTACKNRSRAVPVFQAPSCCLLKLPIWNFLNAWAYIKIKEKSTPRSWTQKKSSVYKSSESSSFLDWGIFIGSQFRLNDIITPDKICNTKVNRMFRPIKETLLCCLTESLVKISASPGVSFLWLGRDIRAISLSKRYINYVRVVM